MNDHNSTSLFPNNHFFEKFSRERSWEPGWMADRRNEFWKKYTSSDFSKIKDERWRFSPKSRFGLQSSSNVDETMSSVTWNSEEIDKQITLKSIDELLLENPDTLSDYRDLKGPELGSDQSYFLTNSLFTNGFFLKVPKNHSGDQTILIRHQAPPANSISVRRNFIILEESSKINLVEIFESETANNSGFVSNLTHVLCDKDASINRLAIQNMAPGTCFHNLENIDLQSSASVLNVSCMLGCSSNRIETRGNLLGEEADFRNYSFVLGKKDQIFDQRTAQHHVAAHCSSNLLSKNILRDQSKSIFSGLIEVAEGAQHSNALQTNRNLLLSDEAEANSLPGLEILANDVKCTHGATTSAIDEDEIFYLQSRGIDKKVAENLIALGFIEEIIDQIPFDEQKENIRNLVSEKF